MKTRIRIAAAVAASSTLCLTAPERVCAGAIDVKTTTFSANIAAKESFDSNVYLQSYAESAERSSVVTTVIPQLGMIWQQSPAFRATLNYTAEGTYFYSAASENNTVHRGLANFDGTAGPISYELFNTVVGIDGNEIGPTWTGPGGAPAGGGPAIRDRRDALVYRGGLKLTRKIDPWLIRPSVSGYFHDFQEIHRATAGYQNYVDRNEFTLGLDVGRQVLQEANGFLGYRFGVQDESKLLQYPEEYDSQFHRLLLGFEGKPSKTLKLSVAAGPEFRHFADGVPAAFGSHDRLNLFIDATATVAVSKDDTLAFCAKRFEQPGFSGRSTYNDTTIDLTWKHKLATDLLVGLGSRAYNTDFRAPVQRDDWIFSANTFLNWQLTRALNAEVSYQYENGQSEYAGFAGREYARHVGTIGIKYTLK